jgi:two-component system, OmpR family, sensor kinase
LNDLRYSAKNALTYSTLVAVILLAPLFFYFIYMKNLYTIKNELELKEKSLMILKSMEEFNPNDPYFEYPRFQTFQSGIYDVRFKPIFTLINYDIKNYKEGYHLDTNDAYLIVKLPKERYFGASYLIVKNTLSYANVYKDVAEILISIVLFVFALSIFFLNNFAKPFQQINQKLDSFIKDSIHEINTPLAIINVNIDLYNRKNPPNKYMQRMKAAVKVLSHIYEDMDYLVKYNRIDHDSTRIDFTKFMKERIEYFTDIAAMKNLQIISEIDENISLLMNYKELQRVVDNNISNAIKYSYENNVIKVSLHVSNETCVMSFEDYGVGIENVDKIFERYYREDTNKGGFGIGLNIVKSIIDKESILLSIKSQPKEGSIFSYTFPHTKISFS